MPAMPRAKTPMHVKLVKKPHKNRCNTSVDEGVSEEKVLDDVGLVV